MDDGHPWFAAFYDRFCSAAEKKLGEYRADVAGGAAGRVLEVGAGTGLNFRHYTGSAESVTATEPDPNMLRRAERRVADAAVPVELVPAAAEELPFPDQSFDTVVCTLVLCTVPSQQRALAEIRRVLRPGGELRFFEHVRADGRGTAALQDAVAPVWRRVFAGCEPNRATVAAITEAGFELERLDPHTIGPPVPPFSAPRPHVVGIARRPPTS